MRTRWEAVYPSRQPDDDLLIAEWVAEHGTVWKRLRNRVPGARVLRAAVAVLTLATTLVVLQSTTASAAVNNPYTGPLPVVDGKIDPAYSSALASISYTQTNNQPPVVTGQIAVLETADAYYVAFQQGLNQKSNTYCANKKNTPGCYQSFNSLVGSDHISFTWPSAASRNGTAKTLQVGVDIITANNNALYGYRGEVVKPSTGNIGEGYDLLGCTNDAGVTGYSGEDYNWHHAGGTGYGAPATQAQALLNSPNFNGLTNQFPDYVYPSTAEIRLDKTQCDLADNLDLAGGAQVLAHNSPGAPTAANPAMFIECAANNPTTGNLGVESFLKLDLIQVDANGAVTPLAGKTAIVSLEPGSVGAITTPANGKATSDANGQVSVGITSNTQGTAHLFGAIDLNNDGYTPGVDPITNPTCPINFAGQITQKLIGHIYLCDNGVQSTTEVPNGTIGATGPETVAAVANPLTKDVKASPPDYTVNATNPPNYHFVPCGAAGTTISPDTLSASRAATVPAGGVGEAIFYVVQDTPGISVELIKTNDANTDGTFHDSEVAQTAGKNVPFHLEIRNTSTVTIKIDALTDRWPGQAAFDIATLAQQNCSTQVLGKTLAPYVAANNGPVLTCDFTVAGYSPPAGDPAKVNTAHVDVSNAANPAQKSSDEDTSAVTVNPQNITVDLVKTNDANVDNNYNKAEVAPAQGATVPFKAVITNTSAVDVRIDTLTDEFPNHAAAGICGNLIGTTLAKNGGSAECKWSEPNYAPAPNDPGKVNTAKVTVSEVGNANNKASDQDTSTVTTLVPAITVDLVKTNNANGDATYTKAEQAPAQGATVPFRAVITNTSPVPVRIDTLTDEWPGHAASAICGNLINAVLQPNGTATCEWSVTNYAPAPNAGALINTAKVTVSQQGNPNNTAADQDTSAVTTPTQGISVSLVKTNNANGDNQYTDAEVAPSEGSAVPFRAVITNTSTVPVQFLTLTDEFPGHAASGICQNFIGAVLQPGASATCEWSEANYAPASNAGAKINTARVTVGEVGNLGNTAAAQDTSAVTTTPPGAITVTLVKTNDANGDGQFNDAEVAPTAGAAVPFRAVITNTSTVAVRITNLTDEFPGHAAAGICGNLVGTTLPPGASVTCQWSEPGYSPPSTDPAKVNTARVTVVDVNHPNNTAQASDTSSVTTKPSGITVTVEKTNDANGDGTFSDSEQAPAQGATVQFKAVITNTSAVTVKITELTDEWPGKAPFGVCAGRIGTTLAPGASVTCTFSQAGYAPAAGAGLTDTVRVVVVDNNNPNISGSDEDTSTVTTPNPQIDLSIVKSDDIDPITLGNGDVTYTIVATNHGPIDATGVVITDDLPGELNLKSATLSNGGPCAVAAPPIGVGPNGETVLGSAQITCMVGDLAVGDSVTLTVVVTPTKVGTFTDVVTVQGDQDETDLTNNQDDEPTTVVAPDLAINKDDNGATFTVGQTNGTYTLVVSNVGNAATFGPITVTDTLPDGLTFVSATGTNWSCTNAGAVITCTYNGGNLAPGETAPTITVTVAVGAAAVPQVINPAHVTTPGDVNPANDNDQEPTPVVLATVQGSEITQNPATPTQVAGTVAYTGAGHVRELVELGLLLLLLGGALLLLGRSRGGEPLVVPAGDADRRPSSGLVSWFDRTPLGPAWDRGAVRGRWNRRDPGSGRGRSRRT
jgi:uncharacterized repeat protein (TIGR01451 family)